MDIHRIGFFLATLILMLALAGCTGALNLSDDDDAADDDAADDDDATDDDDADDNVEANVDCGINGLDPPEMVSGFWHANPDNNPNHADVSVRGPYQTYGFQQPVQNEEHNTNVSVILTSFPHACENWLGWQSALNEAYGLNLTNPADAVELAEEAHEEFLSDDFWIVIFGFSATELDELPGNYEILQTSMSYFVHVDGTPDLEGLVTEFDVPTIQDTWWADWGENQILELAADDRLTGSGDTMMAPMEGSASGSGGVDYTYTVPHCEPFEDWVFGLWD